MKRPVLKPIVSIAVLLVVALAIWLAWPAYTPQIRDERGNNVPGSIASLEQVALGGVPQYILIRGWSANKPILLMLHGGPGMPQMYLAHQFQRELEKDFVVVQWDRRGAGKSYSAQVPPRSINLEQLISDTHELAELLCRRFHQPKIFLAGHSWGTYLGMLAVQRYPELFYAYVGMGQMTDSSRATEVSRGFVRQSALATGNREALRDVEMNWPASSEKWVFYFGGELRNAKTWWPLLRIGLLAPEYTASDALVRIPRGLSLYSRYMNSSGHRELADEVTSLAVPVYFFLGRHDYNTPSELAENYLHALNAPRKKLVWFENSAHFPFLEEPAKFAAEMRQVRDDNLRP